MRAELYDSIARGGMHIDHNVVDPSQIHNSHNYIEADIEPIVAEPPTSAEDYAAPLRPTVRVEMANDVLIGPPGEPFENVRIHNQPDDSCSIKGYHLNDPRNQRISYISAVNDGVTLPAYCLNYFLDAPHGTSHISGTLESGVIDEPPEIRCAVAWLLANGYGRGTVVSEWQAALGAVGLDANDARFITAAAIWLIQEQLDPAARFIPCGAGTSQEHIDQLNIALEKLLELAKQYGEDNPDCAGGDGYDMHCVPAPEDAALTRGTGRASASKAVKRETVELISRASGNCGTGSQPIAVCKTDSEKVKWASVPNIIRIVCGKLLVGPISFEGADASESGDPPEITLEPCCACGEAFSYQFADSCGNPTTPMPGEDFYLLLRITGRFLCVTLCVNYVEWATHVWFIITPGNKQNVGTRQKCRIETAAEDIACMTICFSLLENEPQLLPAPTPIFYPPAQPCEPPPLPPPIFNAPPIVMQSQCPPPYMAPAPPQQILVAPAAPQAPPRIINYPPVIAPTLPAPSQEPRLIAHPPTLVDQPPPPPPPRIPIQREPVMISLPPYQFAAPARHAVTSPPILTAEQTRGACPPYRTAQAQAFSSDMSARGWKIHMPGSHHPVNAAPPFPIISAPPPPPYEFTPPPREPPPPPGFMPTPQYPPGAIPPPHCSTSFLEGHAPEGRSSKNNTTS
jgi:hypothetical protein